MDVTRHREVKTLQAYDRRAKAFKNHAGGKDFCRGRIERLNGALESPRPA
jgi:hypothetical protein